MINHSKDIYYVAVKLLLKKDDKLLIIKDNFGDWDIPGGRIKSDEFEKPLETIMERKLKEELGDDAKISISKMPVVFIRHERIEQIEGAPKVRIFALAYEGELHQGTINLSKRHTEAQWVDIKTFNPEDYFTGGWLKGIKEYLAL